MFCHYHNKTLAIERCQYCGVHVCEECKIILKKGVFCKACAASQVIEHKFERVRNPFVAAFLSLMIPGLGQIYNGQLIKGLTLFLLAWLIIPWFYGIFDAYWIAKKIERSAIAIPSSEDLLVQSVIVFFMIICGGVGMFYVLKFYTTKSADYLSRKTIRDNLSVVSGAVETYKREKGEYPDDFSQLYFTDPPYLHNLLCDVEITGYQYTCEFSKGGYRISAIAADNKNLDEETEAIYTIITGGVWETADPPEVEKEKTNN